MRVSALCGTWAFVRRKPHAVLFCSDLVLDCCFCLLELFGFKLLFDEAFNRLSFINSIR